MYKWTFISAYKYYSRFKNETPRFSATAVVTVSQFMLLFFILALLKRLMVWDFTRYIPNKLIALPIMFIWMAIVHRYYSQKRITMLLKDFDEFSTGKRKLWGVMSIGILILPLILFAFAASKPAGYKEQLPPRPLIMTPPKLSTPPTSGDSANS